MCGRQASARCRPPQGLEGTGVPAALGPCRRPTAPWRPWSSPEVLAALVSLRPRMPPAPDAPAVPVSLRSEASAAPMPLRSWCRS